MSKEQQQQADNFEHLEGALSQGEQFIEKNQKSLLIVVLVAAIIIGGWFGYKKLIFEPRANEAVEQLYGAQNYFAADSFQLALNGDGNKLGFIEIADKYSSTPSGNLAKYYAGLSYLYTSEYEKAIHYLKGFSSDDFLVQNLALANIGDAYMQLGKYNDAANYYGKAASSNKNDFSTPYYLMKKGLAAEKAGKMNVALEAYQTIEKEYPNSIQYREIEKYIKRAELAQGK